MTFNTCLDIPGLMRSVLTGQLAEGGGLWLDKLCDAPTPVCSAEELKNAANSIAQACAPEVNDSPGGPAGLLSATNTQEASDG